MKKVKKDKTDYSFDNSLPETSEGGYYSPSHALSPNPSTSHFDNAGSDMTVSMSTVDLDQSVVPKFTKKGIQDSPKFGVSSKGKNKDSLQDSHPYVNAKAKKGGK